MPPSGKQAWQNPKDIMKTHRVKRQSSAINAKQANLKSSTNPGPKSGFNEKSLPSSEENIQRSQTATASLKRKNPFILHINEAQTTAKRRSILDTQLPSSNSPDAQSLENGDFYSGANLLKVNRSATHPSKLIGILAEAEQMSAGRDSFNHKKSSPPHQRKSEENVQPSSPSNDGGKCCPKRKDNLTFEETSVKTEGNLGASNQQPTDWSLKTKMRVVLESREESFKRAPGIDAKNVTNFVHQTLENGNDWKELDIYQRLRRCCLHYSYPHFPWMRKFPRMSGDFRSRPMPSLSNNDEVLKDIHSDWTHVFTSLYQQLRGGICPYFYVCTHQFTVLFRCQRFSSKEASMSALLSPSTRGFRELLSKEDIAFRLPNIDMHKIATEDRKPRDDNGVQSCTYIGSQSPKESEDIECNKLVSNEDACSEIEDEEDDINDHHGASKWLEGMGLNRKDFPSLEPLKVKLQRDGYREIDNRPQSMLYVEGGDVHAFFNFLLNYPSCIANSGTQYGLPPTLLSPVPFLGGCLVQNTVKHSHLRDAPIKLPGSKHYTYSHVFEISGPILPHHTLNIAATLQDYHRREDGSSVVTYNTHLPSIAFNTQAVNEPEKDRLAVNCHKLFVDFGLANPGLLPAVKDSITSSPTLVNGAYLKELKISAHGFSWSQ